nr:homoserine O-succinyltransferase [Vector pDONR1K18-EHAmetA]
MPITSPGLEAA